MFSGISKKSCRRSPEGGVTQDTMSARGLGQANKHLSYMDTAGITLLDCHLRRNIVDVDDAQQKLKQSDYYFYLKVYVRSLE